jgi:Flp pilus assembly protein TadD
VEDLPVKKPHQRSVGPGSSVPIGVLAERAAEALRQERFKEATELFKLAIRQDPRPEWKEALAVAYSDRARTLAGSVEDALAAIDLPGATLSR